MISMSSDSFIWDTVYQIASCHIDDVPMNKKSKSITSIAIQSVKTGKIVLFERTSTLPPSPYVAAARDRALSYAEGKPYNHAYSYISTELPSWIVTLYD
jgi:hypothetical protein